MVSIELKLKLLNLFKINFKLFRFLYNHILYLYNHKIINKKLLQKLIVILIVLIQYILHKHLLYVIYMNKFFNKFELNEICSFKFESDLNEKI